MNRRRATKLTTKRNQQREELVERRDYRRLLENKFEDAFPDRYVRAQAVKALDAYGDEKPEAYRVRLAVLR